MNSRQIIGTTVSVAIGTLIALAVAGLYVKSQLSAAAGSNTTVGTLLSLFGPKATATSGS